MRTTAFAALCLLLVTTALSADIRDDLARAVQIVPVQPPADLIERIEHRPLETDPGVKRPRDFSKAELPNQAIDVLILNSLPYYPYYALKDDAKYVVHPMAIGRFLLTNSTGIMASDILEAALDVSYVLPNGGRAWYYPRHYRVNRMLGQRLKYSSISQGTIIAGLTGMARANDDIDLSHARRAFDALRWPFEKGGVNLADRAVLEMPSFSSAPEIILNGWIDALLHVRDYAEASGNEDAYELFLSNTEFLAKILPNFEAEKAGLSRYSDLSPYRAKVWLASPEDIDSLRVLYRPKLSGLPIIIVPLKRTKDQSNFSPYENQIFRQNGRIAFVWLSCSQLYETLLVADSGMMRAEIDSGKMDRKRASPGNGGEIISFPSISIDGMSRYVEIDPSSGLICGYPTNFLKGGKENYYHVYHIVALMLIALSPEVTIENSRTMIEWALKWFDDMTRIEKMEGLIFTDTQKVLDRINKNLAIVRFLHFDELKKAAQSAIK